MKRLSIIFMVLLLCLTDITGVLSNVDLQVVTLVSAKKKSKDTKSKNTKKDTTKSKDTKKDNTKNKEDKKDSDKKSDTKDSSENKDDADGWVMNNDGKLKKANEIYSDSGVTSSFKNCKYYDVALPYKSTLNEIGGYIKEDFNISDKYNPKVYAMSETTRKTKIGKLVMREGDISLIENSKYLSKNIAGYKSVSTADGSGMKIITDKNGIQYYMTAIQDFFYAYSGAVSMLKHSNKNATGSGGDLIDVVLKDGTIIHFVAVDVNSSAHTIGTKVKEAQGHLAELKQKQYRYMTSYQNGNTLEIISANNSDTTWFRKKYGLDKNNSIAYYRIYNKKFGDKVTVASEEAKKVSYNGTSVSVDASSSANGNKTTANAKNREMGATMQSGYYSEAALSKFIKLNEQYINLEDATMDSLEDKDSDAINSLNNWKDNIEAKQKDNSLLSLVRKLVSLVGILFTIWVIFIYLAYWFDRSNSLWDLDVLSILTFGRLTVSPEDDNCTFSLAELGKQDKRTVNHKAILKVCTIGLIFGVMLITGKIYIVIRGIINLVFRILGLVT